MDAEQVRGRDWRRWHDDYANPASALSHRLDLVRRHIDTWLDSRPSAEVSVLSACAGQGHDLLDVLGAGELLSYADAAPADLVLFAGVFGNISHADIERSVRALPQLGRPGATVIWTRTRKPPDVTPLVRTWFAAAGFDEVAFDAPEGRLFSVGVHRLHANPQPRGSGRVFAFLRPGTATGSG